MTLQNIRSYRESNNKVTFSDGLNVIMGANGAGKTTLLEAIAYALTGKLPDSTPRQNWVNCTKEPPFQAGITMTVLDRQNNRPSEIAKRFNVTSKSTTMLQDKTNVQLNIDQQLLKYCLLCQEQQASWMFDTDAGLYTTFNSIFGTDKYLQFAKALD